MDHIHAMFQGPYAGTKIAKNLFYADKKDKNRMWVVCACHDTNIDLKALTKTLGCGSGNLRAGSEEAMYDKLGARKGALTLFGILNDTEKSVELVLDKRLAEDFERVAFHPMTNEATTSITKEGMMQVISASQHEPRILDFAALAPAAPAGGAPAQKPKKEKGAQQQQKPKKEKKAANADQRGIEYTKEQNFSKWYAQTITKSELIEYYDVSGCYILRPSSFYIWE